MPWMTYSLHVTPEAEEDLRRILDSYPSELRRAEAGSAIHAALQKLAANPALAVQSMLGRRTYEFSFRADGVMHYWAITFECVESPRTLVVTQVFRPAM